MENLKELFLLDPEIIFLNHGSFGATPIPVFTEYQRWQRELERQPVKFLGRDINTFLQHARSKLAIYLNTHDDNLALIPNATYGVNVIAHSINLKEGDEILTTNHEYGACERTWKFICNKTGAKYHHISIPVPYNSTDEFVNLLWQGVSPRTRLIFLSHITSPTATIFPIEAVCHRARNEGIYTLVDGAHAPGQIHVDLSSIQADFYTGNCHKWMLCPKGSAFLYAHPAVQHSVQPLIVSWGWNADPTFTTGSDFIDHLQWYGTRDPAAHLAIPAAIEFMKEHNWEDVRKIAHNLLHKFLERVSETIEMDAFYRGRDDLFAQMACAPIPLQEDLRSFKNRLYEEYRIEIPCIAWEGKHYLRISMQGYNTEKDLFCLQQALSRMVKM